MNCPHCGREHDAHDGPTRDAQPAAGDVSICWGCHQISVYETFGDALGLRMPTPEEEAEMRASPELREAFAAMAESYYPEQASHLRWGPL